MQQEVHEERYFVAIQHIGAAEGTASTCQVVGIYSSAEGPDTEKRQIELLSHA